MSINVTGPDGRVHTFPNGTSSADIDRAMQRNYGTAPAQRRATAQAARAVAERRGVRSLWERFDDRFQDSLQNSYGAFARWMVTPKDTSDETRTLTVRDPETGMVVQRRTETGAERRAIREGLANNERQRRTDLNNRTQGDEWYRAPGGVAGRTAAGIATIGGEIIGAAADPTSWIGWGRTALARAATNGGMAAASDALSQGSDLAIGAAEKWDASRTALAAATGGAFSVIGDVAPGGVKWLRERLFRRPEARVAAELEVGDDLLTPPLTTREVEPTPAAVQKPQEATLETQVGPAGTNTPDAPQGRPADSPESNARSTTTDTPAKPQQTTEGITVETPDGRVVDVPADPAAKPAGWEGIDWGTRGSPERAQAAKAHLDDLKRWIKPDEVDAFVRALDDGLPDSTTGSRINPRWVDWGTLDDPNEALKFSGAISDIFRTAYSQAGDTRQDWDKTAEIARQLGVSLSDVIKTHADITGEGGIAARAGALRDAALASDKAFYDQVTETRAAMAKGDMTGVPTMVEALNRTVVLGAMDAGASAEIARALQYRQRKAEFAQTDLQGAMVELGRILGKGEELDAKALNKLMDELTDAYEKGGSAGLRQRVATIREMGLWDYVGYAFTANLLSAPTTHLRNAIGTPIHALFQIGERYVAAGIGSARAAAGLGSRERVTWREANAYFGGLFQSWAEPLMLAGKGALRGAPVSDLRSSVMTAETAAQVPFAFSKERAAGWTGPSQPQNLGRPGRSGPLRDDEDLGLPPLCCGR